MLRFHSGCSERLGVLFMKSYLDLITLYGRIHRRKNRLTIICIAISVMLVTAIFSMAELSIKAQVDACIRASGNFHAILTGITDDTASQIAGRKDIAVFGLLGMAEDTVYQGKELVVQSGSEEFTKAMNLSVLEGRYPSGGQEALLDQSGLKQFGLSIGDSIEVPFADGISRTYRITGVYGDFSSLKGSDSHGLMLAPEGMRMLPGELYQEYYYIQFRKGVNIPQAIAGIRQAYGLTEDQVSVNLRLLALTGQSNDRSALMIYLTAFILFVLVTMAGIFMIASSFNMSVIERTQFFGMLRCLGATKKQIRSYIRREGLHYCLKGIPLGLITGWIVSWIAVYVLNTLNIRDFPPMRMFQISLPGTVAGTVIGFLVVMFASGSPAKKASRVSPQAAITGNLDTQKETPVRTPANSTVFHIDTAMGIRHACSNKKSMLLIGGSFAISIILFLCFSVFITFMEYALSPLKPYAPDLSVTGASEDVRLDRSLFDQLKALPDMDNIYGRMFYDKIPASDGQKQHTAMLISYDETQFGWAEKLLVSGNVKAVENGGGVMVEYEIADKNGWKIGDTITLQMTGQTVGLPIVAIASDVPFDAADDGWPVVCSEPVFTELTGISGYTIIDMQVNSDISETVRSLLPPDLQLLDLQLRKSETRAVYYTMAVFVYGFLIVIALVALINIANTINSSVSSRINHYGVMRAVGMSVRQLQKMVCAEAVSYAVTGSIGGSIGGLCLNGFFFRILITANWGTRWEPPLAILAITVVACVLTTLASVAAPTRRIGEMNIVNVVNAE